MRLYSWGYTSSRLITKAKPTSNIIERADIVRNSERLLANLQRMSNVLGDSDSKFRSLVGSRYVYSWSYG